jgi:hypothetical protein
MIPNIKVNIKKSSDTLNFFSFLSKGFFTNTKLPPNIEAGKVLATFESKED